MIYRLMIFLVLCGIVVADRNCLVGGSSSNELYAGWFDPDLTSIAACDNGNGAAVITMVTVVYDHTGGTVEKMLSGAGIGVGVELGMYAYISGTNITADRYEVTTIAGDDSYIACTDIVATGDNSDSVVNIGGAVPVINATYDLQDVLDDSIGSAASQDVDIFITGTGTTATTIDWDIGGGTATTRKSLIGVNTSYVDDGTQATLIAQAAAGLVNGIFDFDAAVTHTYVKNIIFDGNGNGADHCVMCSDINGMRGIVFENCRFTNADDTCFEWGGTQDNKVFLINCEIDNADDEGVASTHPARGAANLFNCKVHDNGGNGIYLGNLGAGVYFTQIYDNVGDGINIGSSAIYNVSIIGNTITRNDGDGIDFNASAHEATIYNNVVIYNGLYSYKFNGSIPLFFSYNLGTTAGAETAITDAVADGDFAALYNGNNIVSSQTEDALFVTVTDGSEDFTPETGSDLIDAGLDVQSTPTIDIGAIQLDAAVGNGGTGSVVGVGWN